MTIASSLKEVWLQVQGGWPPAPIIQVPQKLFSISTKGEESSADPEAAERGSIWSFFISPLHDIISLGRLACA
jgi:hypothetical protein